MSYTIEDYMLNDLNLSGNELLTFAFLSTQGVYKDTLEHMRKMVGMKSVTTLRNTLVSLEEKGLIKKKTKGNTPTIYYIDKSIDSESLTKEDSTPPQVLTLDPNRSYVISFDTQENKCHNIEKINPKDLFRHGAKTRRSLLD